MDFPDRNSAGMCGPDSSLRSSFHHSVSERVAMIQRNKYTIIPNIMKKHFLSHMFSYPLCYCVLLPFLCALSVSTPPYPCRYPTVTINPHRLLDVSHLLFISPSITYSAPLSQPLFVSVCLSFSPTSLPIHYILPSAHSCIFLPHLCAHSLFAQSSSVLPSSLSGPSLSLFPPFSASLPSFSSFPSVGLALFPNIFMYLNLPVSCFLLFPYVLDPPPSQTLPFLLLFPASVIPHPLALSLVPFFSPFTVPLFPAPAPVNFSFSLYIYF